MTLQLMQSELISRGTISYFFLLLTRGGRPAVRIDPIKKTASNFSFSVVGLIRRQRALKQTNTRPLCDLFLLPVAQTLSRRIHDFIVMFLKN